jgi:nitrite reductase/ring-hydroxylating ferredoxin subunit
MWVKTIAAQGAPEISRVVAGGLEVAVYSVDGRFYATGDVCSHEYSRLSDGEISEGRVYCAMHGSAFELGSGKAMTLPATEPIPVYPVRIENGFILVDLPIEAGA